jgi:hypothetical protein
VLPFKLGELSRPLLLDRGRQAGIGVTEAISGVALERLVDGLLICAMLFGGLALCEPRSVGMLADVRVVGWSMVAVFAVGLVVLLAASRDPDRAAGFVGAIVGVVHAGLADRIAGIVGRFAAAMRGVLALRRAVHFAAWSLIYWGVTVLQLWVVLHACGLELGLPEASAIVAIVGLSIQLPGGPVQAGTFQVGTGVALSLFLDPSVVEGAGSVFAAVMYLLQFVGAAVLALPGLLLLGASRRPPPPERSTV